MPSNIVVVKERKNVEMVPLLMQTEHLLDFAQLQTQCATSFDPTKPLASKGLTAQQASDLLLKNGPNMLSPPKKRHPLLMFLDHLLGLFNLMLLISGIGCYIIYAIDPVANFSNVYIGAILITVAFANAYVTFYQVQKSQAILESFLVSH